MSDPVKPLRPGEILESLRSSSMIEVAEKIAWVNGELSKYFKSESHVVFVKQMDLGSTEIVRREVSQQLSSAGWLVERDGPNYRFKMMPPASGDQI